MGEVTSKFQCLECPKTRCYYIIKGYVGQDAPYGCPKGNNVCRWKPYDIFGELEKELDLFAIQLDTQLKDDKVKDNYAATIGFLNQRAMISHIKSQILPMLRNRGE